MAVVRVWETFQQRTGAINEKLQRTYTRTFQVLTNSTTDGWEFIRLAPGIPRPWDVYASASGVVDFGSWCKTVEGRQDTQDPFLWHGVARYTSDIGRPDIQQIENPLLRPADISWSGVYVSKPLEKDRDGNAIVTSSRERFDPPLETEDTRLQLTISRNQITFRPALIADYKNTINKRAWLGLKKGLVRCMNISAERQFENRILFWKVTYTFQVRKRGWAVEVLDRGFFRIGSGDKQEFIPDPRTGMPVTTPVLLDGNGQRLEPGADPVFLEFNVFEEKDFRRLFLP